MASPRSVRSSRLLRPERIGHGILAAADEETMRTLRDTGVVLEVCPTSNLLTKALRDEAALLETVRIFVDRGVRFTIATDGPGDDADASLGRVRSTRADRRSRCRATHCRQRARARGRVSPSKDVDPKLRHAVNWHSGRMLEASRHGDHVPPNQVHGATAASRATDCRGLLQRRDCGPPWGQVPNREGAL